jgi:hypothetical protein
MGRDDLRVVRTLPPIVASPLAEALHFNGGGTTSASSAHRPLIVASPLAEAFDFNREG